ncbi:MAG: phosphate transport system regulatory protein PhoU, partial [Spirochaetes bacterium]
MDKNPIRSHYDDKLNHIKEQLVYMAGLVEKSVEDAVKSLITSDSDLAKKVIEGDDEIDLLELKIEDESIKLLALRQPAARDLRFITTAIKINAHLERIADMAGNIAERAIKLSTQPPIKPYIDIPHMARITQWMIKTSLDAFINEDPALAEKVRNEDQKIDKLNEQVFRELITFMMEDPKTITRAIYIMGISKNLERIADHAETIAEMVVYMVTGKSVR